MKNLFTLSFCAIVVFGLSGCSEKKVINPFLGTWEQRIVDADGNKVEETSFVVQFEGNMNYSETLSDSEGSNLEEVSGVYTFDVQTSRLTITLDDGDETTYLYIFTLRELDKANNKKTRTMEFIGTGDKSNLSKQYVQK